ncbi:MAG: FixH family protein [Solirubrobacteraceae bacterium]
MQRVQHTPFPRVRVWLAAAALAALLGVAALALSPTQDRRALLDQLQKPATSAQQVVPGGRGLAVPARVIRRSTRGYLVTVTMTPNNANGPIALSMHVSGHDRALSGARAQVSFSMPSMNMSNAYTAPLAASARGHYAAAIPVLGMAGRWRLRFDVTPRSGRPFHVVVDDRLAA